ncbi:tryptophan-rich sensory protein [Paracoccus suum]|uniref:Tryptophan-rich sensory protein n=1 Tax=Paracoccus suum TaxID=2259340 RepID=A0A344PG43_9RHOB|nr:TspO/MBR family protein [Paracoccus suum]AXC48348.1 tryptophan-rich sensory protein [Paracoccus suum]
MPGTSTLLPALAWWKRALIAVGPVLFASLLGQLATYPNIGTWYAGLAKPTFNPPNWVFAPVWTTIYLLMAFAVWRILRAPADEAQRWRALGLFLVTLAVNAAWSWMFFAAHSPALGLVNIIPQLALIALTNTRFRRIDPIAGAALLPLLLWVGYATLLNLAIWRLN